MLGWSVGSAPMLGSSVGVVASALAAGWLGAAWLGAVVAPPLPPLHAPTTKALASAIEMKRLSIITLMVLLLGRRCSQRDMGGLGPARASRRGVNGPLPLC